MKVKPLSKYLIGAALIGALGYFILPMMDNIAAYKAKPTQEPAQSQSSAQPAQPAQPATEQPSQTAAETKQESVDPGIAAALKAGNKDIPWAVKVR